jgi:Chaperone for flagella basal body P-ring formation
MTSNEPAAADSAGDGMRGRLLGALRSALVQQRLEGIHFDESAISFPLIEGNSNIRITRMTFDPTNNLLEARVQCEKRGCLPFYVRVQPVSVREGLPARTVVVLPAKGDRAAPRGGKLVKAGQSAMLVVNRPGLRISIPVVCLQSGAVGEVIRARTAGNGSMLMGRVRGKGLLSGMDGAR